VIAKQSREGWFLRSNTTGCRFGTTPALRATPPDSGGEPDDGSTVNEVFVAGEAPDPTPKILSVNAGSFVAGAGDVFRVRAVVGMGLCIGAALAAQFQHAVAESAQEAAIM